MYKIIHIHTDPKFIDETAIFAGPLIKNEVIILGEAEDYKGWYHDTAMYLNPIWPNMNWLINHCNKVDMVVLYNMCLKKSFIANRLDSTVKIAWRFFGQELYRYDEDEQYSELTKAMLEPDKFHLSEVYKQFKTRILGLKIMQIINKYRLIYNNEFSKALNRVDCFLWHYRQEYDSFVKNWPALPPFTNLPTLNLPTVNIDSGHNRTTEKENLILLGNSKNPLNNHFDILNMLLQAENFSKYVLNIPFSYGEETGYSRKLRETFGKHKNVVLNEVFLSLADYELIFKKASAIVINTFRQKALGNIHLALKNDVKVYLNPKNISLSIFSSQGLHVYPVDRLYDDLVNDNILLRPEEATQNATILQKLAEENSIAGFQDQILKIFDA